MLTFSEINRGTTLYLQVYSTRQWDEHPLDSYQGRQVVSDHPSHNYLHHNFHLALIPFVQSKMRHFRLSEERLRENRRDMEGWGCDVGCWCKVGGHARGASELLKSALSVLYQRTALQPNHSHTQCATRSGQ